MKKNTLKRVSALTSAAAMLSAVPAIAEEAAVETSLSIAEAKEYAKVANVQGEFSFDQNVITPSDEVFNIFGTVATAMCARPGFAFDKVTEEQYFINFGGSVLKYQTVSLAELKEMESEERTVKCSCATGPAIANAQVVGVPLSNIMKMVEVEDEANTLTVAGGDGYSVSVPLTYALEKDAILVYQVGDQAEPTGAQLWMPKSVARYFARNVVNMEFTKQDAAPEVIEADAAQRAKISVQNFVGEKPFSVGDEICFEGYADDFDKAIKAVEFSMDGGETWTTCETAGATAEKWVYWHFAYVTEAAGSYKLDVRAVAEDGTVSPLAASVAFDVI